MKFGIVIFPGSNCDHDLHYVLKDILNQQVELLWHKDTDLKKVDAIIIPGGFSYGDYLRAGAIARFSPIMNKVVEFAEKGKFVFGICNGFQILCESKLLPGALLRNKNQLFICKNIYIKTENNNTVLTKHVPKGKALKIPISHGEGNYFADNQTLKEMRLNGQILFHYCDANGVITSEANPNGSVDNIAGICNNRKNVFGMMPHPERAADDELSNTDGRIFFESIIKSLL